MFAEDASWVIAAERFSATGISSYYEAYSRALPLLVLSEISRTTSRRILPNERKARELQILFASRLKLIRERSNLVLARDKILLSSEPALSKKQKTGEAEVKIRKKETEIATTEKKVQKLLADHSGFEADPGSPASISRLAVWKSGTELFVRPPETALSAALASSGIAVLVTGTMEDIGGYLFVTIRLDTGIQGIPIVSVSDAAAYEDLSFLVTSLSARLVPEVAMREPVTLHFSVKPETARVFIDGRLQEDNTHSVTVFAGEHSVSVTAPGFITATRTAIFEKAQQFAVDITLEKEKEVTVAFDTASAGADLFLHTRYFGETPVTITIPRLPAVGEILAGDVHTFFIFDPDRLSGEGESHLTIKPNRIGTEERIEKTRSALYWSLGALYISLPFSMLTYGISLNKYQAYQDGKLAETEAVMNEINGWARAAQMTRYVSIGLGCNVIFQLVRYLFAAEQATPQFAEQPK